MKKIVIFDVDGTIINTLPTISYHVNTALKEHGFDPIEENRYRYILGYGADYLIDEALKMSTGESQDEEIKNKVLETYNGYYRAQPIYLTEPYEGIKDVLSTLKEKGYYTACFSNKAHYILEGVISEFFGDNVFDVVLGEKEGVNVKPDPQGLFNILDSLGLDKDEAIFIGDTEVDIKTGENAGVFTIGVTWGFRSYEDIKDLSADVIIDEVKDILEYI